MTTRVERLELLDITRLEVLDWTFRARGRVFTVRDIEHVELMIQDEGHTLKLFLS